MGSAKWSVGRPASVTWTDGSIFSTLGLLRVLGKASPALVVGRFRAWAFRVSQYLGRSRPTSRVGRHQLADKAFGVEPLLEHRWILRYVADVHSGCCSVHFDAVGKATRREQKADDSQCSCLFHKVNLLFKMRSPPSATVSHGCFLQPAVRQRE